MKTRLLFVLLLFLAISDSEAQNLRAEFALAEFYSPPEGPYLETYLKLKGNSLSVVETESGNYSEVLITYHISKGVWVPFKDTYKIKSPLSSGDDAPMDFIDQRRIPLKVGTYDMEITITDANDSLAEPAKIQQQLVIEKQKQLNLDSLVTTNSASSPVNGNQKMVYRSSFSISDVQLVDSYSKTTESNILSKIGYDLIPFTSNFYPESTKELSFYAEVYCLNQKSVSSEQDFLINMFIENADDGKLMKGLRKFVKRECAEVSPILQTFPITTLPTGNYNLVVEVRDRNNKLMNRRFMFFQRVNSNAPALVNSDSDYYVQSDTPKEFYGTFVTKYQNVDDLKEYLRCLHPISTQEEIAQVNNRMNFQDRNMMWKFMYNFWKQRDPDNPEAAWLKYWKQVEKVNANYSNNLRKGYDTDRGRVYLQYGAPNTISPNLFEPNTYPYEIWHYYVLKDHLHADQSNSKFVFANTEQGDKEYKLIHSDARNEITNVRWNYDLHKRSNATIDIDQEDAGSHYGGRSKEFFDNPY